MHSDFERTLLHGVDFKPTTDLAGYHAMEKFDGHRVRWDGVALRTRRGHALSAPAHFTAGLGSTPFDAELYAGPGQFQRVASVTAGGGAWHLLTLQAFDLPGHLGNFPERHAALAELPLPAHVQRPACRTVADNGEAIARMRETVARGGEGIMLHAPGSRYYGGRVRTLVKLKPCHLPRALR